MLKKSLILLLVLTACVRHNVDFEPVVQAPSHPKEVQREKRYALALPEDFSVSPFSPLTQEELTQDWGKEYRIALSFAEDFDLYRAITNFKRALCLLPLDQAARRSEIEYQIALAYFLGKKYTEVVYEVESTDLKLIDNQFPAYNDLLLILYDSYCHLDRLEHAKHILTLIETEDAHTADKLSLLSTVKEADFEGLRCQVEEYPYFEGMLDNYHCEAKSVRKAEMLNAVLPGAGYWYVEQKSTAITATLINALFIGATVHFFDQGNTAAALIFLSLEGGWYFGGIYGAGLAAQYYNERLYESYACKITQKESLFPIMMLNYSF